MRYAVSIALVLSAAVLQALTVDASAQAPQVTRAVRPSLVRVSPPPQHCLRALDGKCTNLAVVESVRQRAIVFSTVRVSYYGTPAGPAPGGIERFFRDNPVLFGLPTAVYSPGPCCIIRTK